MVVWGRRRGGSCFDFRSGIQPALLGSTNKHPTTIRECALGARPYAGHKKAGVGDAGFFDADRVCRSGDRRVGQEGFAAASSSSMTVRKSSIGRAPTIARPLMKNVGVPAMPSSPADSNAASIAGTCRSESRQPW